MKKIFIILTTVLVLSACLRLDDNLYNSMTGIGQYLFDDYGGEVDFKLDASYTIPADKIHLFTLNSEGNTIYAVYLGDTSSIATDTVIVYCHGNKHHMDFYWQRAKLLANVGGKNRYGVLMMDYRGFGLSEGKTTEEGMQHDVDASIQWLIQRGLTSDRFIIYGFSMGSAPATYLTSNPRSLAPSKLILEAPFASAEVLVQDAAVLAIPGSFVTNLKLNNADLIREVEQPFMWMHGVADDFLSIETHGELIYENYNGFYSEAHRIQGANHGDVPIVWGFPAYLKAVESFVRR